jgi:glucose-6-phosphate isomerase
MLEKRDGVEAARKAIIATTDKAKGALYTLAKQEGYVRFVVPDDIGGRYSVQTAVGSSRSPARASIRARFWRVRPRAARLRRSVSKPTKPIATP